ITQLAEAIGKEEGAEKSLIKIKLFRGNSTEDSGLEDEEIQVYDT
ncbi:1084_t:CDS:2, partial [Racocetra persica]